MEIAPDAFQQFLSARVGEKLKDNADGTYSVGLARSWQAVEATVPDIEQAWVLEFVRAGVLRGCREIVVSQPVDLTSVTLRGDQSWSRPMLLTALLELGVEVPEEIHHLAFGILLLSRYSNRAFTLKLGGETVLTWDRESLRAHQNSESDERPAGGDLILELSNRSGQKLGLFSRMFFTEQSEFCAEVGRLLHARAFTCPVPLTIDTRSVRGLHAHPRFAPCPTCRPLLFFQLPPEADLPAFRLPELSTWERTETEDPFTIVSGEEAQEIGAATLDVGLSAEGTDKDVGLSVLLAANLEKVKKLDSMIWASNPEYDFAWMPVEEAESRLVWVRDGVVVEEEILHTCAFAVLVVVSAQGLNSGSSGYGLERDAEYAGRRRVALARMAATLSRALGSQTLAHGQTLTIHPFDLMLRGVRGTLGMLLVVPGLVIFADLAYGHMITKRLQKNCERRFKAEYNRLLQCLSLYL